MNIERYYNLEKEMKPNKALIIYGARQVGKTTLVKQYLKKTNLKYILNYGDNLEVQSALEDGSFNKIKEYIGDNELIVIDEAQKIKNIGTAIKIMVDQFDNIQVIATGSSSFKLSGQIGEPLVGRKTTLTLFPISQIELTKINTPQELKSKLEDYLIFGSYPAVLLETKENKIKLLEDYVNSNILQDILELEKVKGSKVLLDLLRLIAFQIGSEVSIEELGSNLNIDKKTVARYLDLFEKSFILYNLRGYSRNLRTEITKKSKYYFYDNGIRNALISNFNPINKRNDIGQLWENFIIMERIKKQKYKGIHANNYFWRTWEQKEIDWIEEREGKLFGFEIKYSKDSFTKPKQFTDAYPNSSIELVNKENYLDFIL